ncbi:hypothetical protein TRFO_01674 [Tritrichomonas foetus]|uniref:Chaperone DnaJ C-terminal domain-containing protein n=1 Tax=Tritrichomonas foetus TaxID=1144522 RepID=A0A1J4JQT6_9EUKA|nr:hypothetical protein TRFO_01674 [Tritrichomonas foetus]|eukprot:OHT01098.1 hypothetical protein TRFO_01674 [Tritrichomonas foetus]
MISSFDTLGISSDSSIKAVKEAFISQALDTKKCQSDESFKNLFLAYKKIVNPNTLNDYSELHTFHRIIIDLETAYTGGKIIFNGIDVEILPGTENCDEIILENKEICVILIQPHKYFQRVGNDLFYEKTILKVEMLIGTVFTIKTLDGRDLVVTTGFGSPLNDSMKMFLPDEGFPIKSNPSVKGALFVIFKHRIFQIFSAPAWEIGRAIQIAYNSFYKPKLLERVPCQCDLNSQNQIDIHGPPNDLN